MYKTFNAYDAFLLDSDWSGTVSQSKVTLTGNNENSFALLTLTQAVKYT